MGAVKVPTLLCVKLQMVVTVILLATALWIVAMTLEALVVFLIQQVSK